VGFGYWSGNDVRVEFRPAPINSGIVFVRRDIRPVRRIRALLENRIEMPRRTNLSEGGVRVEMVEHLLAALAGLQIDNCEIHVDAAEMPGHDGSSVDAVNALLDAGIVEQNAVRPRLSVSRVMRVGNSQQWIEARPCPGDRMIIKYDLDYGTEHGVGRQTLETVVDADSFRGKLASARTFILEEDAAWLRSQGLGHRTTYQDLLVFNSGGPINNTLRFPDECVRHKVLDLIGDLALAGCDVQGYIAAHRSGHRLNAELVRALLCDTKASCKRRDSA
jgi:UDP-3-O-[3-hydroxymyristoyl] N-acetylglucosamine deacetylase